MASLYLYPLLKINSFLMTMQADVTLVDIHLDKNYKKYAKK